MKVVGRLAPSPTGLLHLGHARSFLVAYWQARRAGGSILLRMDDLDRGRCRPRYVEEAQRDLQWLGIEWDGAVSSQWDRVKELSQPTQILLQSNVAYRCYCTRAELQALSAPHAGEAELRYPGTCAGRPPHSERERFCIRLRSPAGAVTFEDELWGPQSIDVQQSVGDFVIANRAGVPSYQWATAVDDYQSGVNWIVRGVDLLESTARQLQVLHALGCERPCYLHVPLVIDDSGRRLAKRHDDLSLARLREMGASAESVVHWVAETSGLRCPDRLTARAVVPYFDVGMLSRHQAVVDAAVVSRLCGRTA